MENLNQLKNLRKLYLSYNEIQRLEGIENLHQLEELHLQYQTLPPQQEFSFDMDSLIGISASAFDLNSHEIKEILSILCCCCFFLILLDVITFAGYQRFEVKRIESS